VSSSERLYSTEGMQSKLLRAYQERCKGTKTLIFNNGINTSKEVYNTFVKGGFDVRHLDSKMSAKERVEVLQWFKDKPDAILTSVGILTTGFDEPSIGSIIINRATKSLTLYHQMIGRGSRITGAKKAFTVIDLGNNAARFGLWEAPIDWMRIFKSPHYYYDSLVTDEDIERHFKYVMPDELKAMFAKTKDLTFDMKENYRDVNRLGLKSVAAIERSIDQHAQMCIDNAETFIDAIHLKNYLHLDIEYRINQYTHCTAKKPICMTYEIVGLIIYLFFLGAGVIIYAFSIGKWYPPNPEIKDSAEAFRKNNATWLRIGSLALIAIMAVNVYISLKQLIGW